MGRAFAALVLVSAAGFLAVAGRASVAAEHPTIEIGPIQAVFNPAGRLTRYSVSRYHLDGKPQTVTVTWTLKLELVDKAGAPDPGTPGSGAGVDLGCTNAGVGTERPQVTTVERGDQTSQFVWHHPDPADSKPAGRYGCDHADMGPRGHQGLVTVVVADKGWKCTASYKGTNTSTAESVKQGTASEPKCSPVG